MSHPKKEERERFFTQPEFRQLCLSALEIDKARGRNDMQLFGLVYFGGALGLRLGETITLTKDMFTRLDECVVEIPTFKSKGRPVKMIALKRESMEVVKDFLGVADPDTKWLFPGHTTKGKGQFARSAGHLCQQYAQRLFKRALKDAGLSLKYSPHALRHYFGSQTYADSNGDLLLVKEQLRHTSWKYATRYSHMSVEDRVRRVNQKSNSGTE